MKLQEPRILTKKRSIVLYLELRKEEQTSDWSLRPLSDSQIDYTRLDAEVALTLYDYLAALETRVQAELDLAVPDLMAEYAKTARQRFELTASGAHELAYLQAREQKLKDTIRQKLIDGESPYEGALGRCSEQKVKRTEMNVHRVRDVYPEFASEVIQEYVDRKRFDAVAKERGLPKNAIERVLDTVGFNERLSISLNDDSGAAE